MAWCSFSSFKNFFFVALFRWAQHTCWIVFCLCCVELCKDFILFSLFRFDGLSWRCIIKDKKILYWMQFSVDKFFFFTVRFIFGFFVFVWYRRFLWNRKKALRRGMILLFAVDDENKSLFPWKFLRCFGKKENLVCGWKWRFSLMIWWCLIHNDSF